jgi:hypothetical protein
MHYGIWNTFCRRTVSNGFSVLCYNSIYGNNLYMCNYRSLRTAGSTRAFFRQNPHKGRSGQRHIASRQNYEASTERFTRHFTTKPPWGML